MGPFFLKIAAKFKGKPITLKVVIDSSQGGVLRTKEQIQSVRSSQLAFARHSCEFRSLSRRGRRSQSTVTLKLPRLVSFLPKRSNFFRYCWKDQVPSSHSPTPNSQVVDIDSSWTIVSDPAPLRNQIFLDSGSGTFICGKMSRRQALDVGTADAFWGECRKKLPGLLRLKPNVIRGKERFGLNECYKCFGYRKDPQGTGVGVYSFTSKATDEQKKTNEKFVENLVTRMENVGHRLVKLIPNGNEYKVVQQKFGIPNIGGKNSTHCQFSIGKNYWSSGHTDEDYENTLLSCLSSSVDNHDQVLYYFVFPEYKLAICLCSGDLMWFNPNVLHSCSNPRYADSYIFSCYVSKKTADTFVKEQLYT